MFCPDQKLSCFQIFSQAVDKVCLFTYGSEDTANDLADGSEYQHISMDRDLRPVDWDLCNHIQNTIQATNNQGDCILWNNHWHTQSPLANHLQNTSYRIGKVMDNMNRRLYSLLVVQGLDVNQMSNGTFEIDWGWNHIYATMHPLLSHWCSCALCQSKLADWHLFCRLLPPLFVEKPVINVTFSFYYYIWRRNWYILLLVGSPSRVD